MADKNPIYRIQFINQGEKYELYVKQLSQSNLFGFIEIGEFVWNTHSSFVVDTSEEKLKSEFESVERTFIPMHAVVRIDQVKKQGSAKISSLGDKIATFPSPIYTPSPKK